MNSQNFDIRIFVRWFIRQHLMYVCTRWFYLRCDVQMCLFYITVLKSYNEFIISRKSQHYWGYTFNLIWHRTENSCTELCMNLTKCFVLECSFKINTNLTRCWNSNILLKLNTNLTRYCNSNIHLKLNTNLTSCCNLHIHLKKCIV